MYKILKETREKKGYSIDDMARIIKKSPCNYYKKENGMVTISVTEALIIAKFLNTTVEELF